YGEPGLTRTETIVRRSSYGPPVRAISSGGRRFAASPSSASGFWSNEKMKYDFGLISPSRLSESADAANAIPGRRRGSLSTASGGTLGNCAISDSRSAVREPDVVSLTSPRYPQQGVGAGRCDRCRYAASVIRLGRISYVNMAPVFHRLEYEVEEVTGVPTELNRMLLDGEVDIAPISSIQHPRPPPPP